MTPSRLLVLAFAALLTGCTSTTGLTGSWNGAPAQGPRTATSGWGKAPLSAPEARPADQESTAAVPANTCYVQAPNIPDTPRAIQVLKRPARSVPGTSVVIPAEYAEVLESPDEFEGFAWLPAVCNEHVDRHLVIRIQQALIEKGYDVGPVDGVAGPSTKAGLEYFKRDHGLYGDGYTHHLLKSLGIEPGTGGSGFARL